MHSSPAFVAVVGLCGALWAGAAAAQSARPAAAPPIAPQAEAPADRAEPNVRQIVIEDDGSRIDELRVRGQTQQVVVTPKVGLKKSYEILVDHSGRAPADGTGGANSASGKRVWSVLKF